MLGRVNRVPFPASVRFGSRVSSVRSGSCLRRRATMKSATAIVAATIVMNAGNNSKKSTLVRQCSLPGFRVLVSTAGVEEHHRFVARNLPASDQRADGREPRAAFGCTENALEPCHLDACGHE